MREKIMRFMYGRNGVDDFSRGLLWVTFVCIILDWVMPVRVFYIVGLVALFYSYYRILSKDCRKREQENYWYLNKTKTIRNFFQKKVNRLKMRKEYHLYTCNKCKQTIRIPRGKGKIEITCPKCGNRFVKKS